MQVLRQADLNLIYIHSRIQIPKLGTHVCQNSSFEVFYTDLCSTVAHCNKIAAAPGAGAGAAAAAAAAAGVHM